MLLAISCVSPLICVGSLVVLSSALSCVIALGPSACNKLTNGKKAENMQIITNSNITDHSDVGDILSGLLPASHHFGIMLSDTFLPLSHALRHDHSEAWVNVFIFIVILIRYSQVPKERVQIAYNNRVMMVERKLLDIKRYGSRLEATHTLCSWVVLRSSLWRGHWCYWLDLRGCWPAALSYHSSSLKASTVYDLHVVKFIKVKERMREQNRRERSEAKEKQAWRETRGERKRRGWEEWKRRGWEEWKEYKENEWGNKISLSSNFEMISHREPLLPRLQQMGRGPEPGWRYQSTSRWSRRLELESTSDSG